jgi:hypothetical protein
LSRDTLSLRAVFLLFSAFQGLERRQLVSSADLISRTRCTPLWLHQTRIEALSPWQWRVPRDVALSLGGLEIYPYPHTGLCTGVAERVPFASECQARERGSTREPLATFTIEQGRRRMPCALFLSSLPCPTIAYQQICWGGGLIHYQARAGDGLQRPLRSRFQPRLTRGVSGDLPPADPQEHPPPPHPWRLTFSAPRYMMCS